MTELTVCVLLVLWVLSAKSFGSWINPLGIYALLWAAAVWLHSLGAVDFQPLSMDTLWAVGGMAGLLVIAGIVGVSVNAAGGAAAGPHTYDAAGQEATKLRLATAIKVCTALALVAIVPNLVRVVQAYGLSGLLDSSYQIYLAREAGEGGDSPFGSVLPPLAYVGTMLSAIYIRRHGWRMFCVFPLAAAVLYAVSFGGRNSLIIPAICMLSPTLAIPLARRRAGRGRLWVSFGAIVLGGLLVVVNAAAERSNTVGPYVSNEMLGLTTRFGGLYKAYVYVTVPLAVLNAYLERPFEVFGVNTLFPLYTQLNKIGFDLPLWRTLPSYEVPISANVGTFLMELWIDFGWFGTMIVVSVLGAAVGLLWRRVERTDSTASNMALGVLTLLLSLSFFMWYGRSLSIWVLTIVGVWLGYWIDRPLRIPLSQRRSPKRRVRG